MTIPNVRFLKDNVECLHILKSLMVSLPEKTGMSLRVHCWLVLRSCSTQSRQPWLSAGCLVCNWINHFVATIGQDYSDQGLVVKTEHWKHDHCGQQTQLWIFFLVIVWITSMVDWIKLTNSTAIIEKYSTATIEKYGANATILDLITNDGHWFFSHTFYLPGIKYLICRAFLTHPTQYLFKKGHIIHPLF